MLPEIKPDLQDKIVFQNLPMRTGNGYEVDLFKVYKFIKKVDKRLFKLLKRANKEEWKQLKRARLDAIQAEVDLLTGIRQILSKQPQELSLIDDRLEELEKTRKLSKKLQNTPLLIPGILNTFEYKSNGRKKMKHDSQKFMFRFDQAHDKVKDNPRILDVMAFGTPAREKRDSCKFKFKFKRKQT